jgi:hypothetical protein
MLRRIGRAFVAVLSFARHSVTGLLLFLGALGVVSPILGSAYVWLDTGVNPWVHPDFWRSPILNLLVLSFVGLIFAPIQILIALFRFSGTREHLLFILLTLLCLALWVRGMVRLYRAIRRRRSATGKPGEF